jgi:hypothetical protein
LLTPSSSRVAYQDELGIWTPIPSLDRTDADVSLFFLAANKMSYLAPVDDPWFSAHKGYNITQYTHNRTNSSIVGYWYTDYYVRVIACADQYRICNPSTNNCTALNGWYAVLRQIKDNHIGVTPFKTKL